MGTRGPGLYSNDLAEDLKPLIRVLSRLPVTADQIVELATADFADAAKDPGNEEHSTFWLVLADQLHRAGISAPRVFKRAQTLVLSGADGEMMRKLGLPDGGRAPVDPSVVSAIAPEAVRLMQHCAVHDVSIANRLETFGRSTEVFSTLAALAGVSAG